MHWFPLFCNVLIGTRAMRSPQNSGINSALHVSLLGLPIEGYVLYWTSTRLLKSEQQWSRMEISWLLAGFLQAYRLDQGGEATFSAWTNLSHECWLVWIVCLSLKDTKMNFAKALHWTRLIIVRRKQILLFYHLRRDFWTLSHRFGITSSHVGKWDRGEVQPVWVTILRSNSE